MNGLVSSHMFLLAFLPFAADFRLVAWSYPVHVLNTPRALCALWDYKEKQRLNINVRILVPCWFVWPSYEFAKRSEDESLQVKESLSRPRMSALMSGLEHPPPPVVFFSPLCDHFQ